VTFDELPDLLVLSIMAGGLMPFLAALLQKPRAARWNRFIRIVLAVGAGAGATLAVCPGFDLRCVVVSIGAIVAAAESTYAAWTSPAVDRLTVASSPGTARR
jgi:hypothetical protein